MTLTINLSEEQEARLAKLAEAEGHDVQDFVLRMVEDRLAGAGTQGQIGAGSPGSEQLLTRDEIKEKMQMGGIRFGNPGASQKLLRTWHEEAGHATSEEIAEGEKELQELKRALNANRAINGERLLFP